MDNTDIVALISSGGSVLVAVAALVVNSGGSPQSTVDSHLYEARMLAFESRVDSRLNMMQSDMKDLNRAMIALDVDVAKLKDKADL